MGIASVAVVLVFEEKIAGKKGASGCAKRGKMREFCLPIVDGLVYYTAVDSCRPDRGRHSHNDRRCRLDVPEGRTQV